MSNILVVAASAAALIVPLAGTAWAGDGSRILLANQQDTAQPAPDAGGDTALTPEGALDCPPGSEEAICQNQAQGTATGAAAARDAPQEGMVEPEKADMAMTAEGFEGAIVSDAEDTVVGKVVEAIPAADGQKPERFVLQLDESGKQVAVDASETEVGDNVVKLTGHTMADLEAMEPYEAATAETATEDRTGTQQ